MFIHHHVVLVLRTLNTHMIIIIVLENYSKYLSFSLWYLCEKIVKYMLPAKY